MENETGDPISSKIIDRIFETKKTTFYLILIFLLGLILRIIAAINIGVAADDMHHVIHAINFFKADRLITWDQSSGLWHSFTSIIYNFFGTTQLTSRFASILFGAFSIPVIYLLTRQFFSEKVSLVAAFLLAISPFNVKSTIAEMDIMAMFFVLLGMLLFVRATRTNKTSQFIMSGIFIGASIYTKVYPLLFIPSLLFYFFYCKKKQQSVLISKKTLKKLFIFLAVIFIFTIPTLAHNYLLYKDKGFLDYVFTSQLGIGEEKGDQYYSWAAGYKEGINFEKAFLGANGELPSMIYLPRDFIMTSPNIFLLAFIGIAIILFKKRNHIDYLVFYLSSIILIFPFLAATINLNKHFLFFELLLIPVGAFATVKIINRLSRHLKSNTSHKLILGLILLSSLFFFGITNSNLPHFYGKSDVAQMIDFREENIPDNSLIIMDSRIYRGKIHWVANGRPYLEGTTALQVLNQQEQLPGNTVQLNVYYFECVIDDCGWGTVKDQPDFNASMESLTDFFKQNGQLLKTIKAPTKRVPYFPLFYQKKAMEETTRIYQANLALKESTLQFASQPKNWFLYDVGYEPKESQFDYYQTYGLFNVLLDKIAHWIVAIATFIAFISPLYVIYLFRKQ